jgi:hypothetical protein
MQQGSKAGGQMGSWTENLKVRLLPTTALLLRALPLSCRTGQPGAARQQGRESSGQLDRTMTVRLLPTTSLLLLRAILVLHETHARL